MYIIYSQNDLETILSLQKTVRNNEAQGYNRYKKSMVRLFKQISNSKYTLRGKPI